MSRDIPIVIVAAMSSHHHVIGRENNLLWEIPADMKRFKELTLGHPVIMGRKTFESIVAMLGRPLPNRPNIVLSRDSSYAHDGVEVATSLEAAFTLAHAHNPDEIHIGGGSQLYEMALEHTDRLHLTFVDDEPEGDTHFPVFREDFIITNEHPKMEYDGLTYQWVDFKRK